MRLQYFRPYLSARHELATPAPPQDGEDLARLISGARFHLLEGMGHGSWYGHPHEEINKVIEGIARGWVGSRSPRYEADVHQAIQLCM